MTHLYALLMNLKPRIGRLVVAWMAFMLVAMGTPQIRAAVIIAQSENNIQRIYETETHAASASVTKAAQAKLGRKPFEHLSLEAPPAFALHDRAPTHPAWSPTSPRAPPHSPRGPPTFVS